MVWRIRTLIAVAILCILGILAVLISQSSFLDVDKIKVTGLIEVVEEDALLQSQIKRGDRLLTLNQGLAQTRLARLPWVESASVSRSWGGSVNISIVERKAAAIVFSQHGYVLTDKEGRVLRSLGADLTCLEYAEQNLNQVCVANLVAPSTNGQFIRNEDINAVRAASLIAPEFRPRVSYVVPDPISDELSIQLRGGGWILLGDGNANLEVKISNAVGAITSQPVAIFCGNFILDARNETTVALRQDPSCS